MPLRAPRLGLQSSSKRRKNSTPVSADWPAGTLSHSPWNTCFEAPGLLDLSSASIRGQGRVDEGGRSRLPVRAHREPLDLITSGGVGLHAGRSPTSSLSHAKSDLTRIMMAAHPTARTTGGCAPETGTTHTYNVSCGVCVWGFFETLRELIATCHMYSYGGCGVDARETFQHHLPQSPHRSALCGRLCGVQLMSVL